MKKEIKEQAEINSGLLLDKITLEKKVDTLEVNLKDCF